MGTIYPPAQQCLLLYLTGFRERHYQRLQKPASTNRHIIASKDSAPSHKPAVATGICHYIAFDIFSDEMLLQTGLICFHVSPDQVVIPGTAGTSSHVKLQRVDWHAISAHTLPEISKMRCQSAGATVCFVCRRIAPRKTRARARNDLASLIQRHNIIKLRCRLDVSRPSHRSPLGVMLPRNRRLGGRQVRLRFIFCHPSSAPHANRAGRRATPRRSGNRTGPTACQRVNASASANAKVGGRTAIPKPPVMSAATHSPNHELPRGPKTSTSASKWARTRC